MKNKSMITYAGQAGFIIQGHDGYRIGIDLYLSNCCERYFGFKRLAPYLYNPLTMELDILIATHAHYDHFDLDSVPLILSNPKTTLLAAHDVKTEVNKLNLDETKVTYLGEGDVFEADKVVIKGLPCDHGSDTPDAIGLLLEIDGKKIYVAGDTSYREDYFSGQELNDLDLMIMPINGAFGNMNETEAAKAVNLIQPKLAIPCHYWNFAEHGGNPYLFAQEMKQVYQNEHFILMRPGETLNF